MDRTALAALALPLVLVAPPVSLAEPRQDAGEPPLRFALELDGERFEAEEGREFEVKLGDATVTAAVHVLPTRHFEAAGISFDYPRHMSYEFETGSGFSMWTLDGNSCTIMLQRFDAGDADDLASSVLRRGAAALGGPSDKLEGRDLTLGGKTVKAQYTEVAVGEIAQAWTVIGIESEGKPVVVWLQDTPDDDGEETDEMKRTLHLLSGTFALD